jgi:hypothetical protein
MQAATVPLELLRSVLVSVLRNYPNYLILAGNDFKGLKAGLGSVVGKSQYLMNPD